MGLQIDPNVRGDGGPWTPPLVGTTYADLQACGASYVGGVFRFHDSLSGPTATSFVGEAFPQLAGMVEPFAFDWLGRQYCVVAPAATPSGAAEVVLLDPATMSIMPIGRPEEFLNLLGSPPMLDLVQAQMCADWLAHNQLPSLSFNDCASAIQPAFVGGEFTLENLEKSSIEVYWSFATQVAASVNGGN